MKPARKVQVAGNSMLPPGEDPVPPPMSRDERVIVCPPVEQPLLQSEWCRFNELGKAPDAIRGAYWVNEPKYSGRYYGSGKGLSGCPNPIFRYLRLDAEKAGRANFWPDFWLYSGFFVFSRRFMAILDQEAPGVFDRVPLRMEDREGNFIRDDYVLADCIITRKAIDWANSVVSYEFGGGDELPLPSPVLGGTYIRSDTTQGLNIVRDAHRPTSVFIRRSLADKIGKIRPKITNTNFYPTW
jgi:hypothetical protein